MSRVFPSSRQRIRKVYGSDYAPAQTVTIVDTVNNITRSFDANQLQIHRDFFILFEPSSSIAIEPEILAEYDEDYIHYNFEGTQTRTFNITFSGTPIVTLVTEPIGDQGTAQAFLVDYNQSQLTVAVSGFYSGAVRYRAIYSPTYPAKVQRNVLEPSLYYTASAGFIDLTADSVFTASFNSIGTLPDDVYFGLYDINSNDQADMAIALTNSLTTTTVNGELTSYLTNRINFMAVKS